MKSIVCALILTFSANLFARTTAGELESKAVIFCWAKNIRVYILKSESITKRDLLVLQKGKAAFQAPSRAVEGNNLSGHEASPFTLLFSSTSSFGYLQEAVRGANHAIYIKETPLECKTLAN